jgi:hypothetical protein
VLNIVDQGSETLTERCFAVFGFICIILIEGVIAGVMSALMIGIQGADKEYSDKVKERAAVSAPEVGPTPASP